MQDTTNGACTRKPLKRNCPFLLSQSLESESDIFSEVTNQPILAPASTGSTLDQLLIDFAALFQLRLDSAVKRFGATQWRPISRFHYLSDDEIVDALQVNSALQRAVRLDSASTFSVITVPASSVYHSAESLKLIKATLQECHLKPVVYEFENDWYIYIFFQQAVVADQVADCLRQRLESAGFNTDSFILSRSNSLIPLPLQSGFAWLSEATQLAIVRDDLPLHTALDLFNSDRTSNLVEPALFLSSQVQTVPVMELLNFEPLPLEPLASQVFSPSEEPPVEPVNPSTSLVQMTVPEPVYVQPLLFPELGIQAAPPSAEKPNRSKRRSHKKKDSPVSQRPPPDTG